MSIVELSTRKEMNMATNIRPLAVVTGASSGIGLELAKICAHRGFDLHIAANEPEIQTVAEQLRTSAGSADAVEAYLATVEGVVRIHAAAADQPIAPLLANH